MTLTVTTAAANWKQVRARFESLPAEIKHYLEEYPRLLEGFSWKVTVGYVFSQVEVAHRVALYCGVVKRHRVSADLAWKAIDACDMKRKEFPLMFKAIFETELKNDLASLL